MTRTIKVIDRTLVIDDSPHDENFAQLDCLNNQTQGMVHHES